MHGSDVCKKIRASEVKTPILVLTGTAEVADKVTALDAGC